MTLVIGIEDKNSVILASDSFIGDDDHRDVIDSPKWFKLGKIWFGYAGTIAIAQVAEHSYKVAQPSPGERQVSYLFRVVQGIYTACRDAGLKPDDGTFLLAYKGKVYYVTEGGAPVRSAHGYAAIGSGELQALSALAVTSGVCTPEDRAKAVLEAVSRHCSQVSAPFHTLRV
jgi:ATP-dependent protease HslVU (ClpYQ) peptidase subunit